MNAKRLLIIDDEADFATSVGRVAEGLGFSVEVAGSSEAFKASCRQFDPTVIVLDMVMPETDGTELIQWLAAVRSPARIIIVSGFTPLYAQAAQHLGEASGLSPITRLSKPVSLADLSTALEG
jgi:two-component system response regulator AtoC